MPEKPSSDERGPLSELSSVAGEATSKAADVIAGLWFFAYVSAFLISGLLAVREAVLMYRDQGFGGGTIFMGGLALLLLGIVSSFALKGWRQWRASKQTYEKDPGTYRRAWRTERLSPTGFRFTKKLLGGFTSLSAESWVRPFIGSAVTAAFAGLIIYLFPPYYGWIAAAPVLAGGFHSFYLLYHILRIRIQYDGVAFVMDDPPATLGSTLSGTLETGLPVPDRPPDGFHVVLSCYERRPGSSDQSQAYETHWYAEAQADGQMDAEGTTTIPVDFDLPDDQPPSSLRKTSTRILWRLEVNASEADPPFKPYFDLPVFPAEVPVEPDAKTEAAPA